MAEHIKKREKSKHTDIQKSIVSRNKKKRKVDVQRFHACVRVVCMWVCVKGNRGMPKENGSEMMLMESIVRYSETVSTSSV